MNKSNYRDDYDRLGELSEKHKARALFLGGLGASGIYLGNSANFIPVTASGVILLAGGAICGLAAYDAKEGQEHLIKNAVDLMSKYDEEAER